MSRRNRTLIVITTIIAMSGVFSVHRVVADSAGTSATQADGSPTQIAALARYLDAGELHTCVVLDGGELKCFGANTSGQIGSGGTVALGDAAGEMGDALIAVQLGTGRTVRAVSTGMLHTCALLDNDNSRTNNYNSRTITSPLVGAAPICTTGHHVEQYATPSSRCVCGNPHGWRQHHVCGWGGRGPSQTAARSGAVACQCGVCIARSSCARCAHGGWCGGVWQGTSGREGVATGRGRNTSRKRNGRSHIAAGAAGADGEPRSVTTSAGGGATRLRL